VRRRIAILGITAAVFSASRQGEAYDNRFHLQFTAALAMIAGFNRAEAFELAKYDLATDYDPSTKPISWDLDRRRNYHFPYAVQIEERRRAAFACTAGRPPTASRYRAMGQYLHILEDKHSHKDYINAAMHPPGGPDYPWNGKDGPDTFLAMSSEKFDALLKLRRACFDPQAPVVSFQPAEQKIRAWVEGEKRAGYFGPGPTERWRVFERDFYGPDLAVLTNDLQQHYDRWINTQKKSGWTQP